MMRKYAPLLAVAAMITTALVLSHFSAPPNRNVFAQAGTPSNVRVTNGNNPGDALVSWDPMSGASEHRVGWLAVPDYQANIAGERWRERFAYSDVNADSSYTVTRLTPGANYYFIVGRKQGDDIAWSQWETLSLDTGVLPCPAEPAVAPSTTSTLRVTNGPGPGQVAASWDPVPGATGYRVGWLAVPDYLANQDNNRWQERFAYSDINPASSFTITRLTSGVAYYFILGTKQGDDISWSQWAALALNTDIALCPGIETPTPTTLPTAPTQTFMPQAVNGDYDEDDDGLIEIRTLAQLDAIRYDLRGTSLVHIDHLPQYLAAFTDADDDMGCPSDGCTGYELAAHLDFDTNGNGEPDADDEYWNDGAGWRPITHRLTDFNPYQPWRGTFDGNHYTIANLYINIRQPEHPIGLFADNIGTIQNVNLVGVDITVQGQLRAQDTGDRSGVGSLVGFTDATIAGCTASGQVSGYNDAGGLVGSNNRRINSSHANVTVSGNHNVGGLVGKLDEAATIDDSSALGTVSGSYHVGGLVGNHAGDHAITNSSASGDVSGGSRAGGLVGNTERPPYQGRTEPVINSSSASGNVAGDNLVGGLVGANTGRITDSTATGVTSGHTFVGGLVGQNTGLIAHSEATGAVSGQDHVGGLAGHNSSVDPPAYPLDEITRGVISGSTATGTVVGNDYIGGLTGSNITGNIHSSRAEGAVTGRFYVGGLVGRLLGTTGERYNPPGFRGLVEDSNATGNVTGVRWRDPLVGANEGGMITNSAGSGTVSSPQ